MQLRDILDDPTLFATSPHLRKVPVELIKTAALPGGMLVHTLDGVIRVAVDGDRDQVRADLIREAQRLAMEIGK